MDDKSSIASNRGRLRRQLMIGTLIVYVICLGLISRTNFGSVAMFSGQVHVRSFGELTRWLAVVGLAGLLITAQYFVLGGLLYAVRYFRRREQDASPPPDSQSGFDSPINAPTERETQNDDSAQEVGQPENAQSEQAAAAVTKRWPSFVAGLLLTTVLCAFRIGQFPDLITLALPVLGVFLGVWITASCLRGLRSAMLLVPQLGAMLLLAIGLVGVVGSVVINREPLDFETPQVSADDKARLARIVERGDHLPGGRERLRLSEEDINQMFAAACRHFDVSVKARVQLGEGVVRFDFSLGVPPVGSVAYGYLNSQGVYRAGVENGEVTFRPVEMKVGGIAVPSFLLRSLGDHVVTTARVEESINAAIAAIEELRFSEQQMVAVYHEKRFRGELKRAFRQFSGGRSELVGVTKVHLNHLLKAAPKFPADEDRFLTFLTTAFRLARQRTEAGNDPVEENQGAIIALGILLGHSGVETIFGDVSDRWMKVQARSYRGRVGLRGRWDWTQHYFVSAGLTLAINSTTSNVAGLLKEEIDSAHGGSGFSFSDLLADHAGTRLATIATCDRQSAVLVQQLLAETLTIDDVFPEAADLPEGLEDAEFQRVYGGVDGRRYREMLAEIDRRIAGCRVLGGL